MDSEPAVVRGARSGIACLVVGLALYGAVQLGGGAIDPRHLLLLSLLPLAAAGRGAWQRETSIALVGLGRPTAWIAGATAVAALSGWLALTFANSVAGNRLAIAVFVGGIGIVSGLGGIVVERRAVRRETASLRAKLEQERATGEGERLRFLNELLRHEILNSVNVIHGYAQLLAEQTDEPCRDARLATIRERSESIEAFVTSIRGILTVGEQPTLDAVSLRSVATREAGAVEARSNLSVRVDIADDTRVCADRLLGRVFADLFENAAEHAGDDPQVTVAAAHHDDRVTIYVADDGPGIPSETRAELFEATPETERPNSLFHVRNIVESYGGTLRVADTDDGTIFAVELQAAAWTDEQPSPAEMPTDEYEWLTAT